MNRIYYIVIPIFIISCRFEKKDFHHPPPTTLDSLTLCMNVGFLNCCTPFCQNFQIDLQTAFKTTPLLSTNSGVTLCRDYKLGDSILLNFVYEAIPVYDEFRMSYYVSGYDPEMKISDTIIVNGQTRFMKFLGTVRNKVVLNYVRFDGHGYLSLNLIDKRSMPINEKVDNIENIFHSIKTVMIPVPTNTVKGNIESMTNVEKCDCGDKRSCKLISFDEYKPNKESFVLIEQSQYSSCVEIALLANCIAKEYFNETEIISMSFLEASKSNIDFKRLAKFDIYHCNASNENDFDTPCNYANCIWIDQSLSDKFFDPINCSEWKKYIHSN